MRLALAALAAPLALVTTLIALDTARVETRVDEAVVAHNVTGKGVIVALIDRGVNWQNNDFRNPDGTTRFAYLFDLNDDTGANAPNNPYGAGTVYTREQIDQALSSGGSLPYRDAVGHGDTTTGIAAGNGRNNPKYRGVAPEATLISVKITGGAPAHDNVPAEANFYRGDRMLLALQFVRDKARELGMPVVMLPNVGSQGGPTDGTSQLTRRVDEYTGPGTKGIVFVNGPGDDGGANNRAGGTLAEGETAELRIRKVNASALTFELWYQADDRFEVSFTTPAGMQGPFSPPDSGADQRPSINYFHYAANTNNPYFTPINTLRQVYILLTGAAGEYSVRLRATKSVNGRFHATLNPSVFSPGAARNEFLSFIEAGNIWDGATSQYGIVPTAYINKTNWQTENGAASLHPSEGKLGEIWAGSSTGPTFDGRYGVDVAAPAQQLIAPYTPGSYWQSLKGSRVADGNGNYGGSGAVSAAAPQVTGIVALMLQKNPNLDAAAVKYILQSSARADGFTGAVPNNVWGYGKVDALAALNMVAGGKKPSFTAGGVTNAASFKAGAVAPGELVTIFGSDLGPAALAGLTLSPTGLVSTAAASTSVLFDGVPAPMVYSLAGQISIVVPYSVAGKAATSVVVRYLGVESDPVTVPVTSVAPGVFAVDGVQAAALNQDYSVNSPSRRAKRGEFVVLFATGEGQTTPAGKDGQPAYSVFPKPNVPVTVTVGGVNAEVLYAGAAPGLVAGVMQINVAIPASVATGPAVPVVVKVGSVDSPQTTIAVE